MIGPRNPLFTALRDIVTTGAIKALAHAYLPAEFLLDRHYHGDWGDTNPYDADKNDAAISSGSQFLSAYILSTGVRIWVLTEQERDGGTRAATSVL